MQDPYFGHRDWFTGEPDDDREAWIEWDYALVAALQIIEDSTNKHGLLSWEVDNERMDVIAEKKVDKFQAAVDRRTKGSKKKPYEPAPGEYFVPKLDLRGGEWPTYSDYLEELRAESLKRDEANGTMD